MIRERLRALAAGRFPIPPFQAEGLRGRPIHHMRSLNRILVIRLHAFGDTVITLPLLAALRHCMPDLRLEILTDVRSTALFCARPDVDHVHAIDTRQPRGKRWAGMLRHAIELRRTPYDVVLDLQRSQNSRLFRHLLQPPAWVSFDRFAPQTALQRYFAALQYVGLPDLTPVFHREWKADVVARADEILRLSGYRADLPLVCLNPAAGWISRQWPLERFATIAQWLKKERHAQILVMGLGNLPRPSELVRRIPGGVIDLIGRTKAGEAGAILSRCDAILSEDSGLMHLAWTQGIPTVALFGASRSSWSRPEGPFSSGFYSEDLGCGACMQPTCGRKDLYCLTRVGIDTVCEKILTALSSRQG